MSGPPGEANGFSRWRDAGLKCDKYRHDDMLELTGWRRGDAAGAPGVRRELLLVSSNFIAGFLPESPPGVILALRFFNRHPVLFF
jgi:hypothetical protein